MEREGKLSQWKPKDRGQGEGCRRIQSLMEMQFKAPQSVLLCNNNVFMQLRATTHKSDSALFSRDSEQLPEKSWGMISNSLQVTDTELPPKPHNNH